MKRISIFILAVASLFVFTACPQPEQLPPGTPEEADAQAHAAFIENCSNPGGAYSEICAQGANMDAAQASEQFANGSYSNRSERGTTKYDEREILLPENYKVKGNLLEADGVAHNRILFYLINSKKGRIANNFLDGNEIALERIATIISECHNIDSKQIAQIKENLRPMTTNAYYEQHISKYKNTNRDILFSRSGLSPAIASFCLNIVNRLDILKKTDKSNRTEVVVDFINKSITEILNSTENLSKEENVKLAFLSVLKHSYYYWHN